MHPTCRAPCIEGCNPLSESSYSTQYPDSAPSIHRATAPAEYRHTRTAHGYLHAAPYPPQAPPTVHPARNIIPSNVYAPQTLPLHSPQPLLYTPDVSSFNQSLYDNATIMGLSHVSAGDLEACTETYDDPPLDTFPTPSELLNQLAAQDNAAQSEQEQLLKTDQQRKVQQEAVARTLGYFPTDPDTISTHDKKRYYLDCIEQYVLYLHQQLRLFGVEPVALERVSTNRGLSSKSIRTMLVHMQSSAGKLHAQMAEVERVYKALLSSAEPQPAPTVARRQLYTTSMPDSTYQFP